MLNLSVTVLLHLHGLDVPAILAKALWRFLVYAGLGVSKAFQMLLVLELLLLGREVIGGNGRVTNVSYTQAVMIENKGFENPVGIYEPQPLARNGYQAFYIYLGGDFFSIYLFGELFFCQTFCLLNNIVTPSCRFYLTTTILLNHTSIESLH